MIYKLVPEYAERFRATIIRTAFTYIPTAPVCPISKHGYFIKCGYSLDDSGVLHHLDPGVTNFPFIQSEPVGRPGGSVHAPGLDQQGEDAGQYEAYGEPAEVCPDGQTIADQHPADEGTGPWKILFATDAPWPIFYRSVNDWVEAIDEPKTEINFTREERDIILGKAAQAVFGA
ncbi:MAG: hypothetical protein V3S16_02930 [Candidatus Desulfatibia sp.]|uniref:hypothetical protein n=1 Tax=Candidatus Desulfatibia sp. TaxID=3101189 RepID=UPI002F2CF702